MTQSVRMLSHSAVTKVAAIALIKFLRNEQYQKEVLP